MTYPARPETKSENFGLLAASILYAAAYLLTLREVYSWWIVAPLTLLAFPIAMILSFVVMEFAGTLIGRLTCLIFGSLLLCMATSHDYRRESALTGAAFFILGAAARKLCTHRDQHQK
jgi:hypothetical protein